jgi:sugar phosphate isomerase/epimerase
VATPILPEIGLGCANVLRASLPDLIEAAEHSGFRRITAHPYGFAAALGSGWTEVALRRRLEEAGLEVTMIDALADVFPGQRLRDGLAPDVRAALPPAVLDAPSQETGFRAAKALGAPLVAVNHYLGAPTPLENLAEALGQVCRRAGERGLTVCVEPIPGTGIPDLATGQALVESCDEANARVLLDVFHHDRSGGTIDDVRSLPTGAIAAVQLSDCVQSTRGSVHVPLAGRLMPGDGHLPLRDLVTAALVNNPSATIDVEVLNQELAALPPDEVARGLAAAVERWRAAFEYR